ncbi:MULTISPECIES: hypothetical protein [unclassified Leifsonia]|uniref:hypothetical protein n=1 Tax=unclassified Leifsonia TaxID=2663824 RepID=UPI0006F3C8C9|nr:MULTISPECIES: hypothetical protein [unclassified Leifsonia]KQX05245.1 hypothetical protein ASC59_13745 [Leifsonia sp. Root1293]KRA08878.1 hypothetical protein ASD61_13745 [Leifsonia sp. Root60]
MSSKSKTPAQADSHQSGSGVFLSSDRSSAGAWLAGLIVLVFVAVPISASLAFATNPNTQQLFAGRLSDATTGGYQAFWWIITLLLVALPFLVGFGISHLSSRALAIVAAAVAILVIAAVVLGQLFIF